MSHSPERRRKPGFSHQLKQAEAIAQGPRVRVSELEKLFSGRVFASVIAVLCLPFLQPVPVPGLSVAFGLVIAILGARLIVGRAEALPEFLARQEIDTGKLRKVLAGAQVLFHRLDPLFRRRLQFLVVPPFGRFIGIGCVIGGIAMALPLPPVVLFSNGLPAFGVLLLCLGWIERDGLFVLLGHVISVATWLYFAACWRILKAVALELWEKWS